MVQNFLPMSSKYIRDPVLGYIEITEVEKNIIDTPPVQRLRRIKQLSVSDIAYPGGTHSRFSHAVGTMKLAGEIADSLKKSVDISEEDWQIVRLAGLLHDVGHGPFSHSSESVFSSELGMSHEDLGEKIIKDSSLASEIENQGYDPDELAELIFGEPSIEKYIKQIITSQFDADKMDYLLRDSYFTGVDYGNIDIQRLIQAMSIKDGDIAVDSKVISALETFMIARYQMFLNVYYHHTVRAAEIMLREAMDNAHDLIGLTTFDDIEEYLKWDDSHFISSLRALDPEEFSGENQKRAKIAKGTFQRLEDRDLIKSSYEKEVHLEDEYVAKLLSDDSLRHSKESEIADKAGVDPELVMVDVPTLASMPYYPRDIDPEEVPIYKVNVNGEKEKISLFEHSQFVNVLSGYVDLIRVFTTEDHREDVGKVSRKVFKSLPFSAQLSM